MGAGPDDIAKRLEARFRAGNAVVGIAGLGYVGSEVARAVSARFPVRGYDLDAARARAATNASGKGVKASGDPSILRGADVFMICAPTPLRADRRPDLAPLVSCTESVAARVERGALVICESTTFPSTTEEILVPILESRGLKAGADLLVACSPERIDPGSKKWKMEDIPKVVGGIDPASTRAAAEFYRSFLRAPVHEAPDTRTAEAAKMLENIYRHVNIALANELAVAFEQLGISYWEAMRAAATKPFGYMPFFPGPGAGGHCIPLDPAYFRHRAMLAGQTLRLLAVSDDVNEMMPYHVVNRVHRMLAPAGRSLRGARIAILGLTYKPDVPDLRESAAIRVMSLLLDSGAEVVAHDAVADAAPLVKEHRGLRVEKSVAAALAGAHCVVIATAHRAYRGVDFKKMRAMVEEPAMVDCVGLLREMPPEGWRYACLGEGAVAGNGSVNHDPDGATRNARPSSSAVGRRRRGRSSVRGAGERSPHKGEHPPRRDGAHPPLAPTPEEEARVVSSRVRRRRK